MTWQEAEAALPGILAVQAADAGQLHHLQAVSLKRLGTTPVPLDSIGTAQFHVFRSGDGNDDHIAIELGERPSAVALPLGDENGPLVRLHSACLTGDIFHSRKCDCGPQLNAALESMAAHGHGVLLYLAQEGRSIGLTNKLRAYMLQDAGMDTVDANRALGYGDDEREYEVAAAMLRAMGFDRVRLMTNNPEKIDALRRAGVDVIEQVPLIVGLSPENIRYLKTKATRSGHILPDTALAALDDTLRKK
jgi:GTP cyclohydrolase II